MYMGLGSCAETIFRFFFFKQKTAYEMRISDWSSDVCSSDLNHAFSPLEVTHGAQTLGLPLEDFLGRLKAEGLSTLPGTAAEVLDPEVRAILCPDKVTADEWIEVMRCAHGVGLRTTSTIMFGHVDQYRHWARHLLRIRALQEIGRAHV